MSFTENANEVPNNPESSDSDFVPGRGHTEPQQNRYEFVKHDFGRFGKFYEMPPAGRLELLECQFEDRRDPNTKRWERFPGTLAPVFTGKRRDVSSHG